MRTATARVLSECDEVRRYDREMRRAFWAGNGLVVVAAVLLGLMVFTDWVWPL